MICEKHLTLISVAAPLVPLALTPTPNIYQFPKFSSNSRLFGSSGDDTFDLCH